MHRADIGAAKFKRRIQRSLQRRRSVLASEHQHLDHRAGAFLLTLPMLKARPELVIARRPTALCTPLLERRRTGQGARFLHQHLEVMLQVEYFLLAPEATLVTGEQAALLPELDIGRINVSLHGAAHPP